MRAALAAGVSTRDKSQDPGLQLVPMREFAAARGGNVVDEYVDLASASGFVRRKEWKRLLDDVRHRRVDLVAVWKLDRAFRSAIECLNARRKGVRIGRPPPTERPGFAERRAVVQRQLLAGEIGKRAAARRLRIGAGTLARLLERGR